MSIYRMTDEEFTEFLSGKAYSFPTRLEVGQIGDRVEVRGLGTHVVGVIEGLAIDKGPEVIYTITRIEAYPKETDPLPEEELKLDDPPREIQEDILEQAERNEEEPNLLRRNLRGDGVDWRTGAYPPDGPSVTAGPVFIPEMVEEARKVQQERFEEARAADRGNQVEAIGADGPRSGVDEKRDSTYKRLLRPGDCGESEPLPGPTRMTRMPYYCLSECAYDTLKHSMGFWVKADELFCDQGETVHIISDKQSRRFNVKVTETRTVYIPDRYIFWFYLDPKQPVTI
jgi:hypothetical protein